MSEEKATKHNVVVRLLSSKPITYDVAVFTLAANIDLPELIAEDMLILGYGLQDSEPGTRSNLKIEKGPSKLGNKISSVLSRSPGALGDLYAQYGWKGVYMGGAVGILVLVLLQKFLARTITGNW